MRYLCFIVALSACALGVFSIKSAQRDIWNAINGNTGDVLFLPGEKQTINLSTKFTLITLSDHDDVQSTLKVGYWVKATWKIPGVRWDPKKYKGENKIHVPSDALWVPDIVPYRKHTDFKPAKDSRVIIYNDGSALWVPHFLSTIICNSRAGGPKYPRDQKICKITFGSWVYDGFTLNLTTTVDGKLETEDLDWSSLESNGWKFVDAETVFTVHRYPCCEEPYPAIEMYITIERKDIYFGLALSVPGVVVGLIIALLYLVPPTSSARITSQCICLLIIIFVGVTDIRIMGSTVIMAPAARYFIAAMIIDLFSIFWSIVMSVVWMQASVKGPNSKGPMNNILSKLECICCLPSVSVQQDHQQLHLDEPSDDKAGARVLGLSGLQRFTLVLDRLFCVASTILLVLLFIVLGL